MAADVGQRARLEQQPLIAQLVREFGDARRAQRRQRPVRLAVHQIDHRKPGRDLRARGALQPMVDLVLQQLGRLVEQIDRDQPVGEPPDHLVAAPADRGQLAEIVEQAERIDRRQRIALAGRGTGRSKVSAASSWMRRVMSEFGCAVSAVRMTWKASR